MADRITHGYRHTYQPGPKPQGFVRVLVDIPATHLAVMRARKAACPWMSVNQQIRDAVQAHLQGGFVYMSRSNS